MKRFALIVFGAACALLVLELAVRWVLLTDRNFISAIDGRPVPAAGEDLELADLIQRHPDDRVVYELRPGVRGRFLGVDVRTNALGMRGRERSYDKPPGVFRIAGLGDSHAFGWAVSEAETFYERLERMLNERLGPRRFEVWNLAVPGYNTVQEVRAFRLRAKRLRPDLVVVNYVDNDMDLPNFLAEPPRLFAADVSYLHELVWRRWRTLRGHSLMPLLVFAIPRDPQSHRYLVDARVPPRYRKLAGWDNMERAFVRMARYAKAEGIPAVLLVNPDDYRRRLVGKTTDVRPRGLRELCRRMAEAGYLVVDPQERITRHLLEHGLPGEAVWINAADSHTNPLRHRLVAEELFERLVAAGVLGISSSAAGGGS